jgi:hypothetical protein
MTSFQSNSIVYNNTPVRRLCALTLSTGDRPVYEVPSGKVATVASMWIVNTHTGNVAVRLHHCRAGESPAKSNALIYDMSINSKTTTVYDQPVYLCSGDRLFVRADAADHVSFTVYGSEE